MKILVRNLSRQTTQEQIRVLFEPYGQIKSCTLVMDQKTGKSKGFGFVEMPISQEATKAIKALNGRQLNGAKIRVKLTKKAN